LKKWAMTPKSWKTMGYIIDFKNGSRCVFFSEKGVVSNFFFEEGAVGQKRLGTSGLDNVGTLTSHNPIGLQGLLWDSFTFLLVVVVLCSYV
jgi:hypothetical protein